MTITIIRCDGTEETHRAPPGDLIPAVERLIGAQTLDTVNLRDGRVMFVDDHGYDTVPVQGVVSEGPLAGAPLTTLQPVRARKPDNPKATALYHAICRPGATHRIVGDVAIVTDAELG